MTRSGMARKHVKRYYLWLSIEVTLSYPVVDPEPSLVSLLLSTKFESLLVSLLYPFISAISFVLLPTFRDTGVNARLPLILSSRTKSL